MKALILYARGTSFTGRDGETVQMRQVVYVETMPPLKEVREKGIPSFTIKADNSAMDSILAKDLPGIFDIEIGRGPGTRGKPESLIRSAKFEKPWKAESILG